MEAVNGYSLLGTSVKSYHPSRPQHVPKLSGWLPRLSAQRAIPQGPDKARIHGTHVPAGHVPEGGEKEEPSGPSQYVYPGCMICQGP